MDNELESKKEEEKIEEQPSRQEEMPPFHHPPHFMHPHPFMHMPPHFRHPHSMNHHPHHNFHHPPPHCGGWNRRPHCKLPGFLKTDEYWKTIQGSAQKWREAAQNWYNQTRNCNEPSVSKVSVINCPTLAKQEAHLNYVMVPLILKNLQIVQLIQGCFVGLTDRTGTRCDILVGDVPINFEVQGSQEFAISVPVYVLSQAQGEVEV
jgi:hypothetical protein